MNGQTPQTPAVPFNPTPVEQQIMINEGAAPDGTKLVTITIVQPLTTTVLLLTHEACRALADQLFSRASGLQVVRDVPPNVSPT
jgi:hypothetical protein